MSVVCFDFVLCVYFSTSVRENFICLVVKFVDISCYFPFVFFFFFFKQTTAYEILISDWSSDVCSSDLPAVRHSRSGRWRHVDGGGRICRRQRPVRHRTRRPGQGEEGAGPATPCGMGGVARHLCRPRADGGPCGPGGDAVDECRRAGRPCAGRTGHFRRRTAERRVGKECVRKCISRWSPEH